MRGAVVGCWLAAAAAERRWRVELRGLAQDEAAVVAADLSRDAVPEPVREPGERAGVRRTREAADDVVRREVSGVNESVDREHRVLLVALSVGS